MRRRRYRTCSILPDCALGHYDATGRPLNRLGEPSDLGLDHVVEESSKLVILDARSEGDSWVSPASTLSDEAFSEILASGLVCGYAKKYFIAYGLRRIRCLEFWPVPFFRRSIPTLQIRGVPAIDGAYPRDGKVPNLDDDERGPSCDASLHIGARGQASERSTCLVPVPRGKDKAIVEDYDSSSSNDDDMSSRLRGLTRGPSDEPTGRVKAKVARTSCGGGASRSSLPPPPPGLALARQHVIRPTDQGTLRPSRGVGDLKEFGDGEPDRLYSTGLHDLSLLSSARDGSRGSSDALQERDRQRMVSGLETMLGARNTENITQATFIFELQSDLDDHKKKLQEALDGYHAIREECADLSSELTYEF
uniref:Uncharacterized protein n=1 Tax=Cannabis sativa TaxID=3483 RepID=A0A803NKD3_CANSA